MSHWNCFIPVYEAFGVCIKHGITCTKKSLWQANCFILWCPPFMIILDWRHYNSTMKSSINKSYWKLTAASVFVTRVTQGSISPITAEVSMIAKNWLKRLPLKFRSGSSGAIKFFPELLYVIYSKHNLEFCHSSDKYGCNC